MKPKNRKERLNSEDFFDEVEVIRTEKETKIAKFKGKLRKGISLGLALLTFSSAVPTEVFATQQREVSNTQTTILVDGQEVQVNEDGSFFIGENTDAGFSVEVKMPNTPTENSDDYNDTSVSEISNYSSVELDLTKDTPHARKGMLARLRETLFSAGKQEKTQSKNVAPLQGNLDVSTVDVLPSGNTLINGSVNGTEQTFIVPSTVDISNQKASLIGMSIDITPSLDEETYLDLREYYFGHRALDKPISPFAPFLVGTPVSPPAPDEEIWGNNITIGGYPVSAIRYNVTINGATYEAYCVDPLRAGPQTSGNTTGWEIVAPLGTTGVQGDVLNVLKIGWPYNAHMFNEQYDAYKTRVAAAYVGNGISGAFGGDPILSNSAKQLADGTHDFEPNYHVGVNDVNSAWSQGIPNGNVFISDREFTLSNVSDATAIKFEQGTLPTGSRVLSNGTHIPFGQTVTSNITFTLELPLDGTIVGQEYQVDIVGVNNDNAGGWLIRRAGNGFNIPGPGEAQRLVFYIPTIEASARIVPEDEPTNEFGHLRILKTDENGQPLGGATFKLDGPEFESPQSITVPVGGWNSTSIRPSGLAIGDYTLTEITPPAGYTLSSNPTVTVTVTENHTTTAPALVTITNRRDPDIPPTQPEPFSTRAFIEKVDALSRENIPNATHPNSGALIRLQGMSSSTVTLPDGTIIGHNNTGVNLSQVLRADAQIAPPAEPGVTSLVGDGWWDLTGLPYGMYLATEERAPDGFSLLPQHTSYAFWLAPPDVEVIMDDQEVTWDGSAGPGNVNINVTYPGGSWSGSGGGSPEEGWNWNENGSVTLPTPDFDLEETPNISAVHLVFENYPFSEIVAYKHDAITGEPLSGAHLRIQGFFAEGNAPQITDQTLITDNQGKVVFTGLPAGNYTISEVQPPAGYILSDPVFQSVNVSWGQLENHPTRPAPEVRFYNEPLTYLEVLKQDGNTKAPLSGATYELKDPATGETWTGTTNGSGIAIIGQESENFLIAGRTYILTEISAPAGYILNPVPQNVVLSIVGRNQVTVSNLHNPSLTIIKRDEDTQALLQGAVFSVEFENGQSVAGSPFTTNAQGQIVIEEILINDDLERTLIVTETIPPVGYNLSKNPSQTVTIRAGEDNIITFENKKRPSLNINKLDKVLGIAIKDAVFEVEYLGPTGSAPSENVGPTGPLTGSPFRTDNTGWIRIPFSYSGRYRIREIGSAPDYWLDDLISNREWIIEVRDNEDCTLTVENTLLPSLVITKRNAVTLKPVPNTEFEVRYEVPNSPQIINLGRHLTDTNGEIILPFVSVGWYQIEETRPANGMTGGSNNLYRKYLSKGDNSYQLINMGAIASDSWATNDGNANTYEPIVTLPESAPDWLLDLDKEEDKEYVIDETPDNTLPEIDYENIDNISPESPDTDNGPDEESTNPTNPDVIPSEPDTDNNGNGNSNNDNLLDITEDDLDHINIIDNPQLVNDLNSRMTVTGGNQWQNGQDVWNFPGATRSL